LLLVHLLQQQHVLLQHLRLLLLQQLLVCWGLQQELPLLQPRCLAALLWLLPLERQHLLLLLLLKQHEALLLLLLLLRYGNLLHGVHPVQQLLHLLQWATTAEPLCRLQPSAQLVQHSRAARFLIILPQAYPLCMCS
jgi:hypothetical protein